MEARWPSAGARTAAVRAASIVIGLALATAIAAALEAGPLAITDASLVYVVPVVVISTRFGARMGALTAAASFVAYDYLFTEPRFSLVVADNREWLELLLFLFVALAVGRLSAVGTRRAALAETRAREAEAQFAVSRLLAAAEPIEAVPEILRRISAGADLGRAWVTLEGADARPIADTAPASPIPGSSVVDVLARSPGEEPPRWIRAHDPSPGPRQPAGTSRLRVKIEADGETLGSLWATHSGGPPGMEATRLLALTADQLGLALRRRQLRQAAIDAEVSRQSDALRSRLLTSISHDLRTPLARIRAAAGLLADGPARIDDAGTIRIASEIDTAVARLDHLVRGLLDLGRVESGLLRPDLAAFDLRAVVEEAVERFLPELGDRPIEIDIPETTPPITVDGLLFDEILANLLENVARHAPPPAMLRIRSADGPDGRLGLTVEDGGPGVRGSGMDQLFRAFTRADHGRADRETGGGVGLAVVHGFATAMGIDVSARPSELGGLAISLRIPVAERPAAEDLVLVPDPRA